MHYKVKKKKKIKKKLKFQIQCLMCFHPHAFLNMFHTTLNSQEGVLIAMVSAM